MKKYPKAVHPKDNVIQILEALDGKLKKKKRKHKKSNKDIDYTTSIL